MSTIQHLMNIVYQSARPLIHNSVLKLSKSHDGVIAREQVVMGPLPLGQSSLGTCCCHWHSLTFQVVQGDPELQPICCSRGDAFCGCSSADTDLPPQDCDIDPIVS